MARRSVARNRSPASRLPEPATSAGSAWRRHRRCDQAEPWLDRLLAAQAIEETLTVVSADTIFGKYGSARIWSPRDFGEELPASGSNCHTTTGSTVAGIAAGVSRRPDAASAPRVELRRDDAQRREVAAIAPGISGEDRHVMHGGMGADVEVRHRRSSRPALPPVLDETLPGQECRLPR